MRITKQSPGPPLGAHHGPGRRCVFAVLAWSDLRLKSPVGLSAPPICRAFPRPPQYRRAFLVWPSLYAVRAGFNWGLDYLLMPLYAAAFFYSGILAREAFAPRPGRLRRILTTAGGGADRRRRAGCGRKCAAALHDAVGPHRPAGAHRLHGFQRQMDGGLCRAWRCWLGALSGPPAGAPAAAVEGKGLQKPVLDPQASLRIFRRSSGDSCSRKNNYIQRFRPCTRSSAPAENSIKWPRTAS